MIDTPENETFDPIRMTANLISTYVSNNAISSKDLIKSIYAVHRVISISAGHNKSDAEEVEKPTPAQIKKSITYDALISFEDDKPYKTLRRHLRTRGLAPETYRAKYGLPFDYPMVSPGYSAQRAELARSLGLGQRQKSVSNVVEADNTVGAPDKTKKAGGLRKAS